jgi:hypothetical protein
MDLFRNMDTMIGDQFQKELDTLKEQVEGGA